MKIYKLVSISVGALSLAVAALSVVSDRPVVAVAALAVFGALLLGLLVHTHTRMGANYRQLRSDHERLKHAVRADARTDKELLDLAEKMTPVITRTVARDWSVNASRIASRYEVLEQRVRSLFDELEERSSRMEAQTGELVTTTSDLRSAISGETIRLGGGLRNLPTTRTSSLLVHQAVSEIDALLQLRDRFGVEGGAPLLDGWALSPRAMLQTLDLVCADECEVVLECGSGASTVYIAHLLRQRGRGRVISLEHDHGYYLATRDQLTDLGLNPFVDVRYAPLVDIELQDTTFTWYDPGALEGVDRVDALLVDGPPASMGHLARYPALPKLHERLSRDAVVLVDDASRTDEKEMIARWREEYGLVRGRSLTNDLAVLRRGNVEPDPSAREAWSQLNAPA